MKPIHGYKPAWDPETSVFFIPLGSPTDLQKRPYVHVPATRDPRCGACASWSEDGAYLGMVLGGYTGWAIPGTTPAPRKEAPYPAKRVPEATVWLEWVGYGAGCVSWEYGDGGGDGPEPTLRARSVTLQVPSLVQDLADCRLLAIWARIDLIFQKLSQNGQVSLEYVEKASHSPYIQNGLQNSPLEILRFPLLPAFSHKELMTLF